MLNEGRIKGIASAVDELIKLEDPIGKVDNGSVRPNGMRITKIRVPMGVIGIIYELLAPMLPLRCHTLP